MYSDRRQMSKLHSNKLYLSLALNVPMRGLGDEKMKNIGVLLTGLLLSGCATNAYFVEKNFEPKSGIVGYKNMGILKGMGESSANNLMKDFCGDETPKILSERGEDKVTGQTITATGRNTLSSTQKTEGHTFISFVCQKK
jgi:hypothetical protein